MSEYLTRLTTRARESDGIPQLRPFARSESPIANHDQRVGMAESEDFDLVGASSEHAVSESMVGNFGESPAQSVSTITSETGEGGTIIQRKVGGPAAGGATSYPRAAPAGPPAASELAKTGMHRSTPEIPAGGISPSAEGIEAMSHAAMPAASQRELNQVSTSHGTMRIGPNLYPLTTRPMADEASIASTGSGLPAAAGREGVAAHADSRQAAQVVMHRRSVRQRREIDSSRLEPKSQAFADRFEPSPANADVSSTARYENPRVTIGRINVEVVPPQAQQVASAPRSRPLTAASVSVIGPLGGGDRPNVRLSLRYR